MDPINILPPNVVARIERQENGCWLWTGQKTDNGYGRVYLGGRRYRAHRYVWVQTRGPIRDGMVIDHMCFVPLCVNPEHLREVTIKQNDEHRSGLNVNNTSGVRGVSWVKRDQRWRAQVRHHGHMHYAGQFRSLADAEAAVLLLRAKLFTHDDGSISS